MAASVLDMVHVRRFSFIAAAVLAVMLPQGRAGAQDPQRDISGAHLSAGLGAQAPDFDRSVFEAGYKGSRSAGAYALAVNLRFGRYSALDLLGRERAQADGFGTGARPLYVSILYGFQGPAPLLRSLSGAYVRASAGITSYLGQSAVASSDPMDPQPVPEIGPRFAPGLEFAFGIGSPTGGVRPWSEIRVGGEYLSRTGLGFLGPVVALGVDVPLH